MAGRRVRGVVLLLAVIFVGGAATVPAGAKTNADPVISNSSVLQADANDALVTVDFTSDEPAHWYLEWGTGTSYGSQGPIYAVAAGHTQTQAIVGPALQAGTVYHYRVVVLLFTGIGWTRTFPGPDNTVTTQAASGGGASGPTVTSAVAINASLTCDCFQIRAWVDTRNDPTTLRLDYGTTPSLGLTATLEELAGADGATFVDSLQGPTGLTPGTTYYWQLVATNARGSGESDIQSIEMPSPGSNAPPPYNQADCVPGHTSWLHWTPEPLHATVGKPFVSSLGSGGTPRYTVIAMDDNTPSWLVVDDYTLALTGTPSSPGAYRWQWCVVDSTGQASGIVAEIDVSAAAPVPLTLIRPAAIVGNPSVGSSLRLRQARWQERPLRVAYQWQVRTGAHDWRSIPGATQQTFRLPPPYAHHQVRGTERAWFAQHLIAQSATHPLLVSG